MATSVADQIEKLESARQLVLTDFHHYAAIVPGILPIIGANSKLEIRRWGAEFLAETFASPVLPQQSKESISIGTLQTLKELIEMSGEDATVVKYVIQAVASIYGLVFRHMYVYTLSPSRSIQPKVCGPKPVVIGSSKRKRKTIAQ